MSLHVESEVVGASERHLADAADVRLVAGVLAVVTSQLVGPSEPPLALRPRAAERLLAYTTTTTHVRLLPPGESLLLYAVLATPHNNGNSTVA